jgi:cellulose synthase (UDP-forming)
VPIILAKGLCPANMNAFFKQQYRWCLGSISLLTSSKFWKAKLTFRGRLSYMSGYLYYIHTAISSFFIPVIPIIILIAYPEQLNFTNYLLILPSLIFMHIIFPLWHDATYGVEAWSTRMVYGWAHLSAVTDAIKGKSMQWKPTGSKMSKDKRYATFRTMQILFNFLPANLWVALALWHIYITDDALLYLPMLFSGLYFLFISAKITFYAED